MATLVMDLLSQVMLVAILAGWLFAIDVSLILLLLGMAPFAVGIALNFRRIARRVTRRARRVTASVDPFTEMQIQEGLAAIMRDRTAIVIAHRLSTIKHADLTLVMDHGRIIKEGTHNQLMARGGHYAELYNTYFRHQSLEYVEETSTAFEAT